MYNDDTRAADAVRRHSELKGLRAPLEPLWQDAARRCLPMQSDILGGRDAAALAGMSDNFDATAMIALGKFAAAIESVATPRNAKWHNLSPADPELAEDPEVMRYCEQVRDILFAVRGAHAANFATSAYDVYRMLGVFGHGAMFVHHEVGRGIRYMPIPARELWIDQDAAGVVDTVHREYNLTVQQAVKEFGDELPESIRSLAGRKDAQYRKLGFLHCVFPNPDFDPKRQDARGKRFLSLHLLQNGSKVVHTSGFRTMPYLVPRYETMPGSPYGFGPALTILPEIKMVNEMGKTIIRAAHLATSPPLLLRDDNLLAPFSVTPDSLNYGGLDNQGAPTVRPLETGQRLDIGIEFLQTRQTVINDAFLVTLFQILIEQPSMTATEVLQRANEKGVLLAPVMGRIQAELIGPMIARELDILFDMPGLLPEAPPSLVNTGGLLDVQYASPLAKAQQSGESLGVMRMLEALAPLAQVDPTIFDNINADEAAKAIAKGCDAPARVLRTPDEVTQIRAQRQAAAAAAAQAGGEEASGGQGG